MVFKGDTNFHGYLSAILDLGIVILRFVRNFKDIIKRLKLSACQGAIGCGYGISAALALALVEKWIEVLAVSIAVLLAVALACAVVVLGRVSK